MIQLRHAGRAVATSVIIAALFGGICRTTAVLAEGSYRLTQDWAHSPQGEVFGTVSSVAVDDAGNVYAFRRCPAQCSHPEPNDPPFANLWKFDAKGSFLGASGNGMAKEAHGIDIDRHGFIWTTDVQAHQVRKYKSDGTIVMTLGKAGVPGAGADTFNKPTGVLVSPEGDIFVTDGYGNQRVVKFNQEGKYVKAWGTKGPGPGQFRLPHTIVQDSRGRIYVGDRCGSTSIGNQGCTDGRIEIFDTDGNFIDEWKQINGRNFMPMSLAITNDDRLFVGDSGNGRIWILEARTAKILDAIEGVRGIHGMTVDSNGNVYVAALGGGLRRYSTRP